MATKITKFTENYSDKIKALKSAISNSDCVIIGAGAGLSTSAGYTYSGERFEKYFSDFIEKYGFRDMYSGGFYPFETLEEQWAYWSRYIFINRYCDYDNGTYKNLFELIKNKDYFVLTTNVDHCFQRAGFDKERLFYTQGDFGLFQCSEPCREVTFDNEEIIRKMVNRQKNMRIPSDLLPVCPYCGKPLTTNLRSDDKFVQDEGWYIAAKRYENFVNENRNKKILFLELGVGYNTPVIIKYPFWKMTAENPKAVYACINYGEAFCPKEIENQAICIDGDIGKIISDLLSLETD